MTYKRITKLPTAEEIISKYPLSATGYSKIAQHREEIANILSGKDSRTLVVVGPCSAWPYDATLEYAKRLTELSNRFADKLKLIMRVYIQKPRTVKGWTGPINQPDPSATPDIIAGFIYARNLMVNICEMGLAIADEALFTHNSGGFLELLSWVAIGARSSEDQEHRIHASALDCPVGLKNPTHGSLKVAVNSVVVAQNSHVAVFDGYAIETDGNPYAHLVLRGSNGQPNYALEYLYEVQQQFKMHQIKNPAIMIDVSHDNCLVAGKKDYLAQGEIMLGIVNQLREHPDLQKLVKGFMLESFLLDGNQNIDSIGVENINLGGLSITDPCLGWERTEAVLEQLVQVC